MTRWAPRVGIVWDQRSSSKLESICRNSFCKASERRGEEQVSGRDGCSALCKVLQVRRAACLLLPSKSWPRGGGAKAGKSCAFARLLLHSFVHLFVRSFITHHTRLSSSCLPDTVTMHSVSGPNRWQDKGARLWRKSLGSGTSNLGLCCTVKTLYNVIWQRAFFTHYGFCDFLVMDI